MATREAYEESLEKRTSMRAAPPSTATFGERLAARVDASREFALDLGVAPTALATAAHAIVDVAELVVTQLWYRWQRRRIEAAAAAGSDGAVAAGALIRKGGKEGELVQLESRIKPLSECAKSAAYALLRAAAGENGGSTAALAPHPFHRRCARMAGAPARYARLYHSCGRHRAFDAAVIAHCCGRHRAGRLLPHRITLSPPRQLCRRCRCRCLIIHRLCSAGGGCEIIAGSTGVLILPGLGSYLTLLRELLLPHIGLPALRV